MQDILFKTDDYVFSYRVGGICIRNGSVLLQKPANDTGYAFPGGHVAFGETNSQTLTREFAEETGADITVGDLKWVGEIFFPWGNKPCHQICLYYMVYFKENMPFPQEGSFTSREAPESRDDALVFYWIPLDEVKNIRIYPSCAAELLGSLDEVRPFIYRE
jgi:ADP-ribose pyrophosphatase YjhB (NUDIX family)